MSSLNVIVWATLFFPLALLGRLQLADAQEPGLNESLYTACLNGNVPAAVELLKQGADPSAAYRDGFTPLHIGASQGGFDIVQLLLAKGADPNVSDNRARTPLHMAVSCNRDLKIVKLLVRAGGMLDRANDEGYTPVRLAAARGARPAYEWLVTVSGGKEPRPARHSPEKLTDTTKDLIADLSSEKPEKRVAAQRELVCRGREVMPEVLASIEAGTNIATFYDLFPAMGSEAESALPKLEAVLADKGQVLGAIITMQRMKPGSFDKLDLPSREKAATSLYEAVRDLESKEIASFHLGQLARLGDVAAPHFLQLLRSDDREIQRRTTAKLHDANFASDEINAELVKLSRDKANPLVRAEAADALGRFGTPSPETKAALLAIIKNPPAIDPRTTDVKEIRERQQWQDAADRAARSLARFGPEILDELIPLLSHKVDRYPTMVAIQSCGAPAIPRLIELLAHEDPAVAVAASVTLSKMGGPAPATLAKAVSTALADAVSTGNEQVASQAANALMFIGAGAEDALPTFLEVAGTEERSDFSRVAAAWAAMAVDPRNGRKSKEILACIPALIRVLEKGSFRHQGWAAETLKGIGPAARDALPMLRKRLELPGEDVDTSGISRGFVREQARAAISAIEAESSKPLRP